METFLLACRLCGSWLLVAGPVFQAALELKDQDLRRGRWFQLSRELAPPRSSAWWWLVPPVKLLLTWRWVKQHRRLIIEKVGKDELGELMAYSNKATGWFYVGGGGFLLAANETHGLVKQLRLPTVLFAPLSLALLALCLANASYLLRRAASLVAQKAD